MYNHSDGYEDLTCYRDRDTRGEKLEEGAEGHIQHHEDHHVPFEHVLAEDIRDHTRRSLVIPRGRGSFGITLSLTRRLSLRLSLSLSLNLNRGH